MTFIFSLRVKGHEDSARFEAHQTLGPVFFLKSSRKLIGVVKVNTSTVTVAATSRKIFGVSGNW